MIYRITEGGATKPGTLKESSPFQKVRPVIADLVQIGYKNDR